MCTDFYDTMVAVAKGLRELKQDAATAKSELSEGEDENAFW